MLVEDPLLESHGLPFSQVEVDPNLWTVGGPV